MSSDFVRIHQLILDFRSSDDGDRLTSISKLPEISAALGLNRTIAELIPYLMSSSFPEREWIQLIASLEQLSFADCSPDQLGHILDCFATVFQIDSPAVQKVTIATVSHIIHSLPSDTVLPVLPGTLKELFKRTPSARAAGILLFGETVQAMPPHVFSGLFRAAQDLAKDSFTFVRAAFARAAPKLVTSLKGAPAAVVLSAVTQLASDPSFLVCSAIPQFLIEYTKIAGRNETALRIGNNLMNSPDWRTRCEFVRNLAAIFQDRGAQASDIIAIMDRACLDPEIEVRTAGADQLPFVAGLADLDAERSRLVLESLLSDSASVVKASAARFLPLFTNSLSAEFIASTLLELTKDPAPEVAIVALDALKSPNIAIDVALKCMTEALSSVQWTERCSLVSVVTAIYAPEHFEVLAPVIRRLLFDEAHAVRRSMLEHLNELLAKGEKPLRNLILTEIAAESQNVDYQIRQTALLVVLKAGFLGHKIGKRIVSQARSDHVSNVRLTLALNIPHTQKWAEILGQLQNDEDEDVRDAAM
jgi:serine/threonine-protein phosphatase 2A regulatory subunit A